MSQKPKNFFMVLKCVDKCTYKVSSQYKVFKLLAVAIICEKNASGFLHSVLPLPFQRGEPEKINLGGGKPKGGKTFKMKRGKPNILS